MATLAFAGVTLWNDAATSGPTRGFGACRPSFSPKATRWQRVPLPRGNGDIAKNLGTSGRSLAIQVDYLLAEADIASLQGLLDSVISSTGTVSWPPASSHSNCIFLGGRIIRRQAARDNLGALVYLVSYSLQFEQLVP